MARTYRVQLCMLQPIARTVVIKADSPEAACQKALDQHDDDAFFWDTEDETHYNNTDTFVTRIASGREQLEVPKEFSEAAALEAFRQRSVIEPLDDYGAKGVAAWIADASDPPM